METTRQQKVSKLIQKEMGNLLLKEGRNWYGNGMVSVTIVRISPDLSVAKIYLSIFGGKEPKEVIAALNEIKPEIRFQLGKIVGKQLRIVPEIIFYIDDSVDYFERINTALNE